MTQERLERLAAVPAFEGLEVEVGEVEPADGSLCHGGAKGRARGPGPEYGAYTGLVMSLPHPSIRKLLREHFPGDAPLEIADDEREAFVSRLRKRFKGDRFVDFERGTTWVPEDERARHLCTMRLHDPDGRYSYGSDLFQLRLDELGRLEIEGGGFAAEKASAKVSSFEEIVAFVGEYKRRIERQQALGKRREKVQAFQEAAMVAQVRKLAREEGIDVMAQLTASRFKLWVKLTEKKDAVEILVPPRRFQEVLPRLPAVIRSLRESYAAGVTFKTVSRRSLPWRGEWITYRDPDGGETENG